MRERVQLDEAAPTGGDCIEGAGSGRRRRSLGRSDDRTNVARDGVDGHAPDAANLQFLSDAKIHAFTHFLWNHYLELR